MIAVTRAPGQSDRYSVRAAKLPQDAPIVLSLWTAVFASLGEEVWRRRLERMYDDSPAGQGLLFLLESATAGPVGVAGAIRRRFAFGDRTVCAGALVDFAVAAGHRALGPALKLLRDQVASSRDQLDFMYGFPNERAAAVFGRAKLRKLGGITRYVRPTRSVRLFESRFGPKLAWLLAPLVDAMLWAKDTLSHLLVARRYRYRERNGFDASFDSFWESRFDWLSTRPTLISVRSSRMLSWRFVELEPELKWRVTTAHEIESDEMRGYAVWCVRNNVATVVDFLWSSKRAARALLERVAWFARRSGCHSVTLEFFGDPETEDTLRAAGFRAREAHAIYYVAGSVGAELAPAAWYLTTFDRDTT